MHAHTTFLQHPQEANKVICDLRIWAFNKNKGEKKTKQTNLKWKYQYNYKIGLNKLSWLYFFKAKCSLMVKICSIYIQTFFTLKSGNLLYAWLNMRHTFIGNRITIKNSSLKKVICYTWWIPWSMWQALMSIPILDVNRTFTKSV